MKKIVLTCISIVLIALLVLGIGCAEKYPKMTAPEVCQYVNQALQPQYVDSFPVRYAYSYNAISARHIEKGSWIVEVKVGIETLVYKQQTRQWETSPAYKAHAGILSYSFSEDIGSLTALLATYSRLY